MKRIVLYLILLMVVGLGGAPGSGATVIAYSAANRPDATPGEDLWQYSYAVSGFTFPADHGFTIYFAENLYAGLAEPTAGTNWDPLVWPPDLALMVPGAYDALALVDDASLLDPFTVDFVWLGLGTPGSQPFEIYAFDATGAVAILEEGRTTSPAPIPEPATVLLVGLGLGAVAIVRKRRMSS